MPNFKAVPMTKALWWLAAAVMALVLAACSGSGATEPAAPTDTPVVETATPSTAPGTPETTTAAPATPTAEPDSGSGATTTPVSPTATQGVPEPVDEATRLMRATMGGDLVATVDQMVASGNQAFIPVLMELMRFRLPPAPGLCIPCALDELAGTTEGEDVPPELRHWGWWMEWLGNHPEVQPPAGFAAWKGDIYSAIDPNFRLFFYDGVNTRIRLEEVAWGGVRKDGIPDLQNPPHIPAGEADYILDDDRVFGLSINGEHRAYPLRILNPHEMANDVLGGVPFALSY